MLAPNVLVKTAQYGFAYRASRFSVAGPPCFGEPVDAKGDASAIHRFCNAVCVSDHNVAGSQRNHRFRGTAVGLKLAAAIPV
jgi:hypothetical protein